MGVTIHFEGQLLDESAYEKLTEFVSSTATTAGWQTEPIEPKEVTLLRVRDEQDWDYSGPVKGIAVYLHEDCDPVRLEFDKNLYVQEFTKTQFAGAQVHLKVLELLKALRPFFRDLRVEDEGEYWETGKAHELGSEGYRSRTGKVSRRPNESQNAVGQNRGPNYVTPHSPYIVAPSTYLSYFDVRTKPLARPVCEQLLPKFQVAGAGETQLIARLYTFLQPFARS